MESPISEDIIGVDWISKVEYDEKKAIYFSENEGAIKAYLQNNHFISRLTSEEIKIASGFLLNFTWGAALTGQLIHYNQKTPEFEIGIIGSAIGFDVEERKFKFDAIHLIQNAKFVSKFDNFKRQKEEGYEMTGVEEMAHCLFFEKTRSVGNYEQAFKGMDPVRYKSSDVEYDAEIWQTSYSKHYMPSVYPNHRKMLDTIIERRESK